MSEPNPIPPTALLAQQHAAYTAHQKRKASLLSAAQSSIAATLESLIPLIHEGVSDAHSSQASIAAIVSDITSLLAELKGLRDEEANEEERIVEALKEIGDVNQWVGTLEREVTEVCARVARLANTPASAVQYTVPPASPVSPAVQDGDATADPMDTAQ